MLVTPLDLMRLGFQAGLMAFQAQQVMSMRMLGAMGGWRTRRGENTRMLTEKVDAMREAAHAVGTAVGRGKSPVLIADAAMKPFSRRTKSNAKSLSRRGPGRPA